MSMTEHPLDLSLAEELKQTDANGKVDALFGYMRRKGNTNYDENVTQLQHGLQSAALARSAGATPQQAGQSQSQPELLLSCGLRAW